MTVETPSRSPDLEELLELAVESYLLDLHVALPAKIEKYDHEKQEAEVKPLVQRLVASEDGQEIPEVLPKISGVPVVWPRGGDFFIHLPVKAGDFCLLIFNSYPIDAYKAGKGKDAPPNEFATHELGHAVALMGFAPFAEAIADADKDNLVLGRQNGTQVHISDSKIELGQKDASERVPVDSKLQSQLSEISNQINSLGSDISSLASHTHATSAPGAPTGPPLPPPAGGQSYSPGDTASALVTLKE